MPLGTTLIQDSDVQTLLAATLKVDPSALPSYWNTLITQGHQKAENDILQALLNRGFSQSQVLAWDQGAYACKALSLFHTLLLGGMLSAYDDKFIKEIDIREELKSVQISNNGVWQAPAPTNNQGIATTGDPVATGVNFAFPDPGNTNSTGEFNDLW